MNKIAIVAAGAWWSRSVWLIEQCNRIEPQWEIAGFIEADPSMIGQRRGDYEIIGDDDYLLSIEEELYVIIGTGRPGIIQRIRKKIESNPHLRFPNIVHPSVLWDRERTILGLGNLICAGNILTTNIRIGSFNLLNLASTYGHDVAIGDCNVINAGCRLSGNVTVGNECLIGTGAIVLETRSVGDGATIAAGSVVTKDVPPGATVAGIGARVVPK